MDVYFKYNDEESLLRIVEKSQYQQEIDGEIRFKINVEDQALSDVSFDSFGIYHMIITDNIEIQFHYLESKKKLSQAASYAMKCFYIINGFAPKFEIGEQPSIKIKKSEKEKLKDSLLITKLFGDEYIIVLRVKDHKHVILPLNGSAVWKSY